MKKIGAALLSVITALTLSACSGNESNSGGSGVMESKIGSSEISESTSVSENISSVNSEENSGEAAINIPENFTLIKGGTFQMGSPESEPWRGSDEARHAVTVSDFYMILIYHQHID